MYVCPICPRSIDTESHSFETLKFFIIVRKKLSVFDHTTISDVAPSEDEI